MTTFAVITLVVIFILLTHLHNWLLRFFHEENNPLGIIGTSFIVAFTYWVLIEYIIRWGMTII